MSARVLHAALDLADGFVDQLDCADAMAALIGCRRLQLALGRQQMVEGRLHVWLTGCAAGDEGNDEDSGKQECQSRPETEDSVKVFHVLASVTPVELDALFDLHSGFVDQADGFGAMSALVGIRHFELLPGGTQVLERGLHVRLCGEGASCEEPAEEGRGQNEKTGGETPGGTRKNCRDHVPPPFTAR
jgi:hypothetical protein